MCACDLVLFRAEGVMRTMNTEKLIKTLPVIQNQLDALLDFQVNGVNPVTLEAVVFPEISRTGVSFLLPVL